MPGQRRRRGRCDLLSCLRSELCDRLPWLPLAEEPQSPQRGETPDASWRLDTFAPLPPPGNANVTTTWRRRQRQCGLLLLTPSRAEGLFPSAGLRFRLVFPVRSFHTTGRPIHFAPPTATAPLPLNFYHVSGLHALPIATFLREGSAPWHCRAARSSWPRWSGMPRGRRPKQWPRYRRRRARGSPSAAP